MLSTEFTRLNLHIYMQKMISQKLERSSHKFEHGHERVHSLFLHTHTKNELANDVWVWLLARQKPLGYCVVRTTQ